MYVHMYMSAKRGGGGGGGSLMELTGFSPMSAFSPLLGVPEGGRVCYTFLKLP